MSLPPIHVIDFEGNLQYGIVEFGLVTLKNGEIQDIVGASCRPISHPTQWHSRFPNHDTEASFRNYLPLFIDRRKTGPFAAHHTITEDRLLRLYQPIPGISSALSWGPWIDTLKLYKKHLQGLKSYTVSDLIRNFQLQHELDLYVQNTPFGDQFHRAVYDAVAAALLLKNFIEQFHITEDRFLFQK